MKILQTIIQNEISELNSLINSVNQELVFGQSFWLGNDSFDFTGQWIKSGGQCSLAISLSAHNQDDIDSVEGLNVEISGIDSTNEPYESYTQSAKLSPTGTAIFSDLPALSSVRLDVDLNQIRKQAGLDQIESRGMTIRLTHPESTEANVLRPTGDPTLPPRILLDGPDFQLTALSGDNNQVLLKLKRIASQHILKDRTGMFVFTMKNPDTEEHIYMEFVIEKKNIFPKYAVIERSTTDLKHEWFWDMPNPSKTSHPTAKLFDPKGQPSDE